MLDLRNQKGSIRKDNSIIACEAFLEDCEEPVNLRYSIEKGAFLPFQFPKGYEYCKMHIRHARQYFESLGDEEPPEQMTIMWY